MASDASLKLLKTASKCAELVIGNYECQSILEDDETVIRDLSQAVLTALQCVIENKAIDSSGLAELCAKSIRKSQIDRVAFAVSALVLELLSDREKQSSQSIPLYNPIYDQTPPPPTTDEDEIEIIEVVNLSNKVKEVVVKKEIIDERDSEHPESQVDNESAAGRVCNVAGELYPEDVEDTTTAIKTEEVDPCYPVGDPQENTLPPDHVVPSAVSASVKLEPRDHEYTHSDAVIAPSVDEASNENLFVLAREDPNTSSEVKMEPVEQAEVLIELPVRRMSVNFQERRENESSFQTSTSVDPTYSMMDDVSSTHEDQQANTPSASTPTECPFNKNLIRPSSNHGYSFLNTSFGALTERPPPKKRARSGASATGMPTTEAPAPLQSMSNRDSSTAARNHISLAFDLNTPIVDPARLEALESICTWSLREKSSDADRRAAVLATLVLNTNLLAMEEIAGLRKQKVWVVRRYSSESVPALIRLVRETGPPYQQTEFALSPTVGAVWERHMQMCRTKRTPLLFPVTCSNRQFGTMSASFMQVELKRAFDGAGVQNMDKLLPPFWQIAPTPSSSDSSCEVKQED